MSKKIKYKFKNYILEVDDEGFTLKDIITDELLLDGSILNSTWSVEGEIDTNYRDFYMNIKYKKIIFGFSNSE